MRRDHRRSRCPASPSSGPDGPRTFRMATERALSQSVIVWSIGLPLSLWAHRRPVIAAQLCRVPALGSTEMLAAPTSTAGGPSLDGGNDLPQPRRARVRPASAPLGVTWVVG